MLHKTPQFWTENWRRHFGEYVSYLPFQAYYLYCLLESPEEKLLEIAGGSFHDTSCLNSWGISCTGIDLCREVIRMAKEKNPALQNKLFVMDAKRLDFNDKTFDVSFHNGFLGYFEREEDIHPFLEEQVRVTKRLIVCSVHNELNSTLLRKFRRFSLVDDLYNIRFYTPRQLKKMLKPFCRTVEVRPFQVPEFDQIILRTEAKDFIKEIYNRYYHTLDIGRGKRLMAVGYL